MLVDADLSRCRVLNNAEMLAQVHLAILSNADALPRLCAGQPRREAAMRLFAAGVTAQLLLSNTRFVQLET